MSVVLDAQLEAIIRQKVESGLYADADAVLREALRLLDERDRRLQDLRAKLQVGLEQIERGETVAFTPELLEEISREAEEMVLRGEEPDPDVCP